MSCIIQSTILGTLASITVLKRKKTVKMNDKNPGSHLRLERELAESRIGNSIRININKRDLAVSNDFSPIAVIDADWRSAAKTGNADDCKCGAKRVRDCAILCDFN